MARHLDQRGLLWAGRLAVFIIAMLAMWMALDPHRRVLDLVAHAWAGFGAAFGPTLLLTLHWPGMTRSAAAAGMVTGGISVIIWHQLEGGWFNVMSWPRHSCCRWRHVC